MYVWRVAPDDDDLTETRSLTRMPFEQLENVLSLSSTFCDASVQKRSDCVDLFSKIRPCFASTVWDVRMLSGCFSSLVSGLLSRFPCLLSLVAMRREKRIQYIQYICRPRYAAAPRRTTPQYSFQLSPLCARTYQYILGLLLPFCAE